MSRWPIVSMVGLASFTILGVLLVIEHAHPGFRIIHIGVCAAVLIPLMRLARALAQRRLRRQHKTAAPTLLVGDGDLIDRLARHMRELPEYGLLPVGVLGCTPPGQSNTLPSDSTAGVPYLGALGDFAGLAVDLAIEEVVIAQCAAGEDELVALVRQAHGHDIRVWVVPIMHDASSDRAYIDHLGGLPMAVIPPVNPSSWQFAVKYAMDRIAGAAGLLILSPVMLTLALLVRLSSPGPVFFRQRRVGRDGKPFDCLKFRSMRPPRDSDAAFELKGGAAPGGVEGVDRRTRIGKIMRATSLDELPQLINVLRGEMSLVGPRPERPEYVELFEEQIKRYGERHRVKAGLTGWAQVHGLRGQTSIDDRVEWDNYYIENWSVRLDFKILALTVLAVLKRAE